MPDVLIGILAVTFGGFLGGLSRWGLLQALPERVAVLVSNVLGSLALGIGLGAPGIGPLLLAVGGGGGLSTWSTFANQMAVLVERRQWARLTTYLTATVALCIIAAWRGTLWAARIFEQWSWG